MQELKTWPESFQAIWDGTKTYDIRQNDRKFTLWSVVHFREYDPAKKKYSGRELVANIVYLTFADIKVNGTDSAVFGIKVYQKIDKNKDNAKAPKV